MIHIILFASHSTCDSLLLFLSAWMCLVSIGGRGAWGQCIKQFAICILFQLKTQQRLDAIKLDQIDWRKKCMPKSIWNTRLSSLGNTMEKSSFLKRNVVVDGWILFECAYYVHACKCVSLHAYAMYSDEVRWA